MAADEELVRQLDLVWGSTRDLGRDLTDAEWKRPTEVPGWSVQDNLAHLSGIEWGLLGRPAPDHVVPEDLEHVKNDVGKTNEVFVDSRRARSGADVLAEFCEVSDARLAQLRSYAPEDFARDSWTPVGPGAVRDLLPFRIFDSWVHEQDMRRAVRRPGDLDGAVAEAALERIVGAMPFVVGKKAAAPDGATVVFALSGPMARTLAIGVEGGRARPVEPVPPAPSTRILTDTETFARVATGRVEPGAAVADGRVTVEGDEALGRAVVDHLNFLF